MDALQAATRPKHWIMIMSVFSDLQFLSFLLGVLIISMIHVAWTDFLLSIFVCVGMLSITETGNVCSLTCPYKLQTLILAQC